MPPSGATSPPDPLPVTLILPPELERISLHANQAWLGGRSNVRGVDRNERGPEDQMVGQVGEFALARYVGDEEAYFERRRLQDLDPWRGDGGSDLPGVALDVKTSRMRGSRNPRDYNLLVRPRERHPDNLYLLAITLPDPDGWSVWLVGYAHDGELPPEPVSSGVLAGAFRLPARRLRHPRALRTIDKAAPVTPGE